MCRLSAQTTKTSRSVHLPISLIKFKSSPPLQFDVDDSCPDDTRSFQLQNRQSQTTTTMVGADALSSITVKYPMSSSTDLQCARLNGSSKKRNASTMREMNSSFVDQKNEPDWSRCVTPPPLDRPRSQRYLLQPPPPPSPKRTLQPILDLSESLLLPLLVR